MCTCTYALYYCLVIKDAHFHYRDIQSNNNILIKFYIIPIPVPTVIKFFHSSLFIVWHMSGSLIITQYHLFINFFIKPL